MRETTEEKVKAENCMAEQREFFALVSKAMIAAAQITELDTRLSTEIREIRSTHEEFQKTLKPVLDAYAKGMTIKSKAGTIAIGYVVAMALFPQLSPSSIVGVMKMIL